MSTTLSHRYGCDTLFYTGTFAQLEQVQNKIVSRLKLAYNKRDKEELAVLSALACENLKAIGFYKGAIEYGEQSISYFEELLVTPQGKTNLQLRYDYVTVLFDMAELSGFLLEDINVTIKRYVTASEKCLEWMKAVSSLSQVSILNRNRINHISLSFQKGSCIMSLLSHDYVKSMQEADDYLKEVANLYDNKVDSHIEYAEALHIKASIYSRMEDFEKALAYWKQSLIVIERSIGKNNKLYASTLEKIAEDYYQLNDLSTALSYIKQSNSTYYNSGHEFCVGIAECLELGSLISMNLGKWQDCISYLDTAGDIIKATCGDNSYQSCIVEWYKIYSLWGSKRYTAARKRLSALLDDQTFMSNLSGDAFLNALSLSIEIDTYFRNYYNTIASETTYEGFLKTAKYPSQSTVRNLYIAIGRAFQGAGKRIEACARFDKALSVEREMIHQNFCFLSEEQRTNFWSKDLSRFNSILLQNRTTVSGYNALGPLLYDASLLQKSLLLDASINLAHIIELKGSDELKKKMNLMRQMMQSVQTDELKKKCQALESEVQNEARELGDFVNYTNVTWKDIRAHLKDHEVAIEFVCSENAGTYWYSAEILRKDMSQPYHLFLFTADKNNLSLESPDSIFTNYAKKVIWSDELLAFLKPGDNVFFSPSGDLYKLPIEYMTLKNGKNINDVYYLHRVSSTRVLVNRNSSTPQNNKTIALFGGFNYNTSVEDMQIQNLSSIQRGKGSRIGSDSLRSVLWKNLPGTLKEVSNIDIIMNKAGYRVSLFTGDNGLEENFKNMSEQHTRIIHIATHGFFFPLNSYQLNNSGLIFTGGNNFWLEGSEKVEGIDDGILTAEEISNLNFIGTDLVVLSACQSGLGRISGEGVFGLQRSFKKAGVQSLLMSLWEVDDEATQIMMSAFYHYYASEGNKYESLKKAQNDIKNYTFIRNGKKVHGDDPYFWAAFILID